MSFTNPIPADAPPFVNVRVLAGWLGVHRITVTRWVESGILPRPMRMGPKVIRFDTEAVRAAVDRMFEAAGTGQQGGGRV